MRKQQLQHILSLLLKTSEHDLSNSNVWLSDMCVCLRGVLHHPTKSYDFAKLFLCKQESQDFEIMRVYGRESNTIFSDANFGTSHDFVGWCKSCIKDRITQSGNISN